MKWWHWLILELLIIFGVIAWIFFFPCKLWEEDFCKALLAYVLLFCIEKIRKHFRKERIDIESALTECMEKNYKRAIGEGDK